MNASTQPIDNGLFREFTPLNSLDHDVLEKLAGRATIQRVGAGNFLFERGDTTAQTVFLLEGEIELCSPVFPTQRISAGSDAGRYPLGHSFPRQCTAAAVTDVRILVLALDILEVIPVDSAKGKASSRGTSNDAWKKQWLSSAMLRNLPNANKKALLSKMKEITVQAGQVIIHQEEPADSYFVVKKGRCSVSRRPAHGARDVKLAELTEGQGFGEEALITNVPRNASVTMLTDGILLRLSKQDFIALLARPLLHHLPFQNAIELVEQGAVLIDVRAPEEFEIDGLIGSLNMPFPVLRLKANRLHRDCTYIVYSNTGQFSSVAAFLLIQQGLKAYVLQGGLSTAPKYRMKRGAFNEDDAGKPSKKVLPFPHSEESRNSDSFAAPHNTPPGDQQQAEVDWNLISDDVLWRSTIGYRQDDSVDAAIAPKQAKVEISSPPEPHTDSTAQGFDDIRLFTTIHPATDMSIGAAADTQSGSGASRQSAPRPINKPTKGFTQTQQHEPSQWSNKIQLRSYKRPLLALSLILFLTGGGIAYYFLTNGSLSTKLKADSPHLLEQQRKLDAKVTRLLDAIASMPALQSRDKTASSAATSDAAPQTAATAAKSKSSGNTPKVK
ncbi:MAG: cyclic nucleotide-binding domain-containing protein [Gammaproteobacteria bacterium]